MNNYLKLPRLLPAALLLTLASAATAIASPPDAAMTCTNCHGEGGVSTECDTPTLAGLSDFYLENQLVLFREEARPCAAEAFEEHESGVDVEDHCAIAKSLSKEQVSEITGYFSAEAFVPAEQPFEAEKAEHGARIHELRCERCHADSGSDPLDDSGILAGQWTGYLRNTLQDFRSGERWQPDGKASALEALDDDAIEALMHHYAKTGTD